MKALYKVTCGICPNFLLTTDSAYEAKRIRQFHDNWGNIWEPSGQHHEARIAASRFAQPVNHVQVHLEDAPGVSA